jgi:hypothetical protein
MYFITLRLTFDCLGRIQPVEHKTRMKDEKKEFFDKIHMTALILLGAVTALFFFFKILFG